MEIYKTAEAEGIITFSDKGFNIEVNGMLKTKWYSFVYRAQKYAIRLNIDDHLEILEIE